MGVEGQMSRCASNKDRDVNRPGLQWATLRLNFKENIFKVGIFYANVVLMLQSFTLFDHTHLASWSRWLHASPTPNESCAPQWNPYICCTAHAQAAGAIHKSKQWLYLCPGILLARNKCMKCLSWTWVEPPWIMISISLRTISAFRNGSRYCVTWRK